MSVSVRETLSFIGRSAKRIAVAVIGGAFVVAGIVFLVLPGPGILVIALGFAILATEFAWAHHALEVGKRQTDRAVQAAKRGAGGAVNRVRRRR